ncbi:MAG: cytochrome c [Paucimonas sp.]|nr:cytochrome c [Paucimonas sp.]
MKRLSVAAMAISMLALPYAAHAQFAKPEDAVKYRQSALSVMGTHFGRIGAVVKGEKPYDKASVEQDAMLVETLAKLPWHAFTPGSDTANSKAKPEIWKESDKFKSASDKLVAETGKLSAAAKSGSLDTVKTAFGGVGQSCKACHDDFRKK